MNQWPWDDYMKDYDPYVYGRDAGKVDGCSVVVIMVSIVLFVIAIAIFLSRAESADQNNKQVETKNTNI